MVSYETSEDEAGLSRGVTQGLIEDIFVVLYLDDACLRELLTDAPREWIISSLFFDIENH